jgi:hypothetical protein
MGTSYRGHSVTVEHAHCTYTCTCTHTHYTLHTLTHSHTPSLITDDDGSYLPRPEWAKATGANIIQIYGDTNDLHIDSTLSDLEEEALYISREALEDFVPIGEGTLGDNVV